MTDPRFEAGDGFTDLDIAEIESALGRELPADYREFVKNYGGAFVGGTVDGTQKLPILDFFKSGRDGGIIVVLNAFDNFKDDSVLPIARDEFGNKYVQTPHGSIYYINYYSGATSAMKIANSFSDFVSKIVVDDE